MGNLDLAIADYTQAIALKPELARAYHNRGNAYYKKNEVKRAIANYTKALELKSDLTEAYYNRGEARLHLGEWENAKSDFMIAKAGLDIVAAFHNDYESVSDFEQKNGVKLPEDIAAMLTP